MSQLVREEQDAVSAWRQLDRLLIELVGKPADKRNLDKERELHEQSAEFDTRIRRLNAALQADFPLYRELMNPEPIALLDAQKLLSPDEALISWLVLEGETLLFLVRDNRVELAKIPTGREGISQLVKTLRGSTELAESGDTLPFPDSKAKELYNLLFSSIENHLDGINHLILVPDGPLQSLSFGLLETSPDGATKSLKETPWLARKYALTTLPAITSLRALRKLAKTPGNQDPFIGFGDPDLKGDGDDKRGYKVSRLFARGLVADTRAVSEMQPLPDTADELRSIAKTLKAGPNSIYLRGNATETRVRTTSLSGYRVVAFATHALMAGEFKGVQEPALVLTPPTEGTEEDDGLLTASEVAGLKLDADWVILSACNTAAPDGTPGAQGFTGLTKAFFYAGARSLLVSHWAVDSKAAAAITTRMFTETEMGVTKAEALRRAMMALADDPETAHPALWAPFVVVGEGAR